MDHTPTDTCSHYYTSRDGRAYKCASPADHTRDRHYFVRAPHLDRVHRMPDRSGVSPLIVTPGARRG